MSHLSVKVRGSAAIAVTGRTENIIIAASNNDRNFFIRNFLLLKLKNICNQPEGCYCRSKNSAYHSLQSKEWSSVAPHFGILMLIFRHMKKRQSQRLWCKHLYALHTARWESRQSAGTDALTLRFTHSQCRFCVGDSHPVSLCRLSPTVFRMLYSLQALL